MKRLKLTINGSINSHYYEKIFESVTSEKEFDEIILFINSTGGDTKSTFAIYDLLKSCDKKIISIALGRCASMATALFALGDERYISLNTEYLLHQTNITFKTDTVLTSGELARYANLLMEDEEKWKDILMLTCTGDISDLLEKAFSSLSDTILDAAQVIKYGLATDLYTNINEFLED